MLNLKLFKYLNLAQLNLNQIERLLSYEDAYEKQKSVHEFRRYNLGKFCVIFYFALRLVPLQELI